MQVVIAEIEQGARIRIICPRDIVGFVVRIPSILEGGAGRRLGENPPQPPGGLVVSVRGDGAGAELNFPGLARGLVGLEFGEPPVVGSGDRVDQAASFVKFILDEIIALKDEQA